MGARATRVLHRAIRPVTVFAVYEKRNTARANPPAK
jgi:hypothetical protein